MFQQDYILRQIRMMVKVLEQVIVRKKQGQYEEAQQLSKQALRELFGDRWELLPLDETISSLEKNGRFNSELAFMVAELLYEQASLPGDQNPVKSLMQSLLLYKKALQDPDAAFPIHAPQKIAQIEDRLSLSELGAVTELLS